MDPSPTPPSPSKSPVPLNPRQITFPQQIGTQLALLTKRQAELSLSLNALVADREDIDESLEHLTILGQHVERLVQEVDGRSGPTHGQPRGLGFQPNGHDVYEEEDEGLLERVRKVWETSERVGGKVRRLDVEVGRVKESVDIVSEVIDLKNSLMSLSSDIAKEDWESASRACRRAMSVRKQVIDGNFAGSVVPTSQYPLPPSQTLQELRDTLLQTFRHEFDTAVARKDQPGVSRFFRLWPAIGAEEEGLEVYGNFVVGLVKARSPTTGKSSSPLYYLTSLTNLLESIAHIIDQHQPVVDKYYGPGRMVAVIGRLISESDRVVRNLVEGWEEERRVGRLIGDTKSSSFLLLSNPSLLPPLFPSLLPSNANPITLATLANSTTSALPNLSSASHLLQSYTHGGRKSTPIQAPSSTPSQAGGQHEHEQEGPDPRDVDKVLAELVALGGRWALFRRFIWSRIADEDEDESEKHGEKEEKREESHEKKVYEVQMEILEQSGSQRAIENLLKVYYEPLEFWFLRMSIEKAHKIDTPDLTTQPHLSSILDDTFYLLKLVLSRLLSCGSLSTLKNMRRKIAEVIEKDYTDVIRRKMDNVHSLAGGGDRTERERREKDQREAFSIYLNDLDVSANYMERLIDETLQRLPQVFIEPEMIKVQDELEGFKDIGNRFRSVCKAGLEQLFNQLTRPRLRPILDDAYRDVNYLLDDDTFQEAEEMDLVRKRFVKSWDNLVLGYRESFTEHNFQTFFSLAVEVLVRHWEKMILSMRFTELGAIRYERDIRSVANYLSAQTSFGGAREKFTRLQQIGTILNLDVEEDPQEFYSNSGVPWRISKVEYDSILEQRQ
ncbi:hypothetical protein J010_06383 [Cryptococcus neoformans]|nr:hypothetical protein C368_06626 [Cryptococcus neoformans var. grubii 125.91]OXG43882.1 hypothetical protein C355_06393 [Cryptococcus neoformans var. grubii Th84]OXH01142.1 hypothetical protein J010_06383 [Cryptococcus neoformans var. grubii]OXH23102.1 hypothetical protein J009_06365 [Cryptococcus neoformans var. grubii]OXH42902.1 hypothetical protein J004_06389 [Cryptococcus neoformans var. grubii]